MQGRALFAQPGWQNGRFRGKDLRPTSSSASSVARAGREGSPPAPAAFPRFPASTPVYERPLRHASYVASAAVSALCAAYFEQKAPQIMMH